MIDLDLAAMGRAMRDGPIPTGGGGDGKLESHRVVCGWVRDGID